MLGEGILKGLAESRSVAPVPDSDTVAGELVALLTTEMLPVALPATVLTMLVLLFVHFLWKRE